MAQITIVNGHELVAPATETEILLPQDVSIAREIKFRVTSGTVQVTTARRGIDAGVIGGNVHAYTTGEPDFMTVEPGSRVDNDGVSMYVKGTGTIIFSF